jgi:hypothetical protein
MKCPSCQADNRGTRKFCAKWGEKLLILCPQCSTKNLPDEQFCGECGHSLTSVVKNPYPKDLSFDEKLAKIQKYLPGSLTEKIISQTDRIEGERRHGQRTTGQSNRHLQRMRRRRMVIKAEDEMAKLS